MSVFRDKLSPMGQRRAAVASLGDLSAADLQAIADGGIMDCHALYLPAGKLTEAETRAREARILVGGDA